VSGLAVRYQRDGRPADRPAVDAMLAAIPYRGPDGRWSWCHGAVALGYGQSAVTPEEQLEQQPHVCPRSGCALVADIRLDNRPEVLAQLPERLPAAASDAAVALAAYLAWGIAAFRRLLGDFAVVVWDPRREQLVCARDAGGQRGLFYWLEPRIFAAASEIHPLLLEPETPLAPNHDRIREFLTPINLYRNEKDHHQTFYQDIFAVPAGHALIVDARSSRLVCHTPPPAAVAIRYRRDEEYAEQYLALFQEVVRSRLRSVHPLGVLLSGGLDSSSIACVAQELYRAGRAVDRGFLGLSLVFPGMACDEQSLIGDIQAKYGFPTRLIPAPDTGGWLTVEPRGFQEAPNMGLPTLRDAVVGAAQAAGIRVLLTGDIADSYVGGSPLVFDALIRRGRLLEALRRLFAYRRMAREPLRTTVALHCLAPLLPRRLQIAIDLIAIQRRFAREQPWLVPAWMPAPLRQELVERHRAQQVAAERARRFANPGQEAEYQLLVPPEIARHPAPWSVEFWRPFADRRLQTFMLSIPPELKYAPHPATSDYYAGSKRLVRQALRGIVPESVRTRTTKTHFEAVFEASVERQWPAYEAVFGPGARPLVAGYGYIDHARFWERLMRLRSGEAGGDLLYLVQMISLETWLRALQLPRSRAVAVAAAPAVSATGCCIIKASSKGDVVKGAPV